MPDSSTLAAVIINKQGRILQANSAFRKIFPRGGPHESLLREASDGDVSLPLGGKLYRMIGERLDDARWRILLFEDVRLQEAHKALERAVDKHRTFLHSVSHDLRLPLASAEGYAALLNRDSYKKGIGPDAALYIERLLANIEQLDEMLKHILELSRVGASRKAPKRLKMGALIEKVIDQFGPRIMETRTQIRVASKLPDALGDELQIRRVFQNLIENALKFKGDRPLKIDIGYDGGAYVVRDNGVGIPEAFQNRIWDAFYKLDPSKPGSGIGLTLVKAIVEEYEGRIRVESRPNEGAAFYVELPHPK